MNFQQRQQRYRDTVAAQFTGIPGIKFSDAFGFSNSAKIVEGGLFAFNANLDRVGEDLQRLVVHCVLRFPPQEEIYFSLVIGKGRETLLRRLQTMRSMGTSKPMGQKERAAALAPAPAPQEALELDAFESLAATEDYDFGAVPSDELSYTDNNKNVKGYIANDGRLYLRNKAFWDSLPEDLSSVPDPVEIDQILFSVWPAAVGDRNSLLTREFIGYLGQLIGPERVHELLPWGQAGAISAAMRRMPATLDIAAVEQAIAGMGGHYPHGEVRRLHAALNFSARKHFVILAGLSGTGKTQLAQLYARAVHGISSAESEDPLLRVCAVRPDWTDPSGLTGYPDVLSGKYVVPPFLEALLLAAGNPEAPVFVVLDEMNLARVEYYFAELLSCLETKGERLKLHAGSGAMEGSTGVMVPRSLELPKNLFIIGTINVDETTQSVSDKVLDRAQLIDMSRIDVEGFLATLASREPSLGPAIQACSGTLVSVHRLLDLHGPAFGYRVAEDVIRYAAFAAESLGQSWDDLLDDLMVQKILVKLRGTERQRPLLSGLRDALAGRGKAQSLLDRLFVDLDDFGSFQASR